MAASGVFERFVDDVTGMQKESGAVFADRQDGGGFDSRADQCIGCGGGAERACPAEQITEHETEPFTVGPFEKDGTDGRKNADGGGGGSGVFQSSAAGERGVDGFQKPGEVFRWEKRGKPEKPAPSVKADGLSGTVPGVHDAFVLLRV